jgi:hypothetical protein
MTGLDEGSWRGGGRLTEVRAMVLACWFLAWWEGTRATKVVMRLVRLD